MPPDSSTDTITDTDTVTSTDTLTTTSSEPTTGTDTATSTSLAPTPTCTAHTGVLELTGGSYNGYVSSETNGYGEYLVTTDASEALQVQYQECDGAISYGPMNFKTLVRFPSVSASLAMSI